ncbi:hypothetical protein IV203_018010 [Nitzschia inconspicua]|uniref:Uncharacterized protein n=1 Tax=Nitzschia inconspicua TaxID=303405 RepID=A0A9K3M1E4_9STRA|nr:hypothetical protein IV203_018010 [Nitzschia inconspicua]
MSSVIQIDSVDMSPDQVMEQIRQAAAGSSTTTDPTTAATQLILDLGCSKKTMLDSKEVEEALITMIVQTWSEGRKWKSVQINFGSDGFVEQDSKEEDRWHSLEEKAKQQTSRLGRNLQRRLDLDETQIRLDGDIHTEVDPNCNCKYTGMAVISFTKNT